MKPHITNMTFISNYSKKSTNGLFYIVSLLLKGQQKLKNPLVCQETEDPQHSDLWVERFSAASSFDRQSQSLNEAASRLPNATAGKRSTAFTGIWCCWRNTTWVYLCWKNTSAERSDAAATEREVKQEEKCFKIQLRLFPVTLLHSTKQSFKNTAEIWNGRRGATTSSDLDLMLLCSVSSPLFWRQLCVLLYISNYSTSSTTSGLIWAESSASEWIKIWAESNFDSEVSNFYPDGDRKASSACPRKLHTFVLRLNWALTRL